MRGLNQGIFVIKYENLETATENRSMKIITKTASGKKTLRMSRREWEKIGRIAGFDTEPFDNPQRCLLDRVK